MKLQPDETDVMGRWIETRGGVGADDTCGRIDWLVNEVLEEVAVSPEWGAWEVLFRDPSDGRYWERTYPPNHRSTRFTHEELVGVKCR